VESSQRRGRHRWRIERTIAWLLGWRRLRVRYERCDERFFTFRHAGLLGDLVRHAPAATAPATPRSFTQEPETFKP
jgi:hypothetical protein